MNWPELAVPVASLGMWRERLPAALRRAGRTLRSPAGLLHGLHSRHSRGYVAWWLLGTAALGGALLA